MKPLDIVRIKSLDIIGMIKGYTIHKDGTRSWYVYQSVDDGYRIHKNVLEEDLEMVEESTKYI
jgi:hypothetical protein